MNLDEAMRELDRTDLTPCYEAFQTTEAAEAGAKRRGVVVRYPTNYELFLDFDTKEYPPKFRRLLGVVNEVWGIAQYAETGGVSGRGRHVRIQLRDPLSDTVRIPLQAMLGSDPMRELLHWTSWEKSHPYVQVLFEKEGYEETPVDWMKIFSDC